jgi:hypothetical protein
MESIRIEPGRILPEEQSEEQGFWILEKKAGKTESSGAGRGSGLFGHSRCSQAQYRASVSD